MGAPQDFFIFGGLRIYLCVCGYFSKRGLFYQSNILLGALKTQVLFGGVPVCLHSKCTTGLQGANGFFDKQPAKSPLTAPLCRRMVKNRYGSLKTINNDT